MTRRRRLLIIACILLSARAACAVAQPAEDVAEDRQRRQIIQLMQATQQLISDSNWLQAADAFDAAWAEVSRGEDLLLSLNASATEELRPGQHEVLAGARAKLEELWRTAPEAFRQQYSAQQQPTATTQLQQAMATGDPGMLQEAVIRFQYTAAASQAARTLIGLYVSRGEFLEAALETGRLQRLSSGANDRNRLQWDLIRYWWLAGLEEEAVDSLRHLLRSDSTEKFVAGYQAIPRPVAGTDLRDWLAGQLKSPRRVRPETWQQSFGNYRRTQVHSAGPAELTSAWSASAYSCEMTDELNPLLEAASAQVRTIAMRELAEGNSIASTAVPIATDDLIVYRAVTNIHARNRHTGELVWESGLVDRQLTALANHLRRLGPASDSDQQRRALLLGPQLFNHWARANAGGQLTTDGTFVFAVEEVTAATLQIDPDNRSSAGQTHPVNYLRAYELATGRLRGQAGGSLNGGDGGPVNPLAGMYFLGAPLVMGERIYVLSENDQGIYLLQLQAKPRPGQVAGQPPGELDLRPVQSQLLSIPQFDLEVHPLRKYSGVIPSFAQGLLICSTCDERVIAVSAEDHSVRWVYRYRGNVAMPELGVFPVIGNAINQRDSMMADQIAGWLDSLPRIAAERILLTPRDSDRLICLDLHSGMELWTRPRGAMRAIAAVTENTIVLTGPTGAEAIRLEDGASLWRTELDGDIVCGQAATNGRIIQVPTSAPAIESIDIESGRRLLTQSLGGEALPGNLLGVDGDLFSQSLRDVRRFAIPDEAASTPLLAARELLLQQNVNQAENVLADALAGSTPPSPGTDHDAERQLLIDTLLESLRLDYRGNAEKVPRVRQLIAESSPPKEQVAALVQSMLGMNPVDAAVLPAQWQQINRTRRQLDWLRDTAAQGLLEQSGLPIGELAEHILQQFDDAYVARDRDVATGPIICQADRRVAKVIHQVIARHSDRSKPVGAELRAALVNALTEPLRQRIRNASSPAETYWWCQICLQTGLAPAIAPVFAHEQETLPAETALLVRTHLLADSIDSGDSIAARRAVVSLLDLWRQNGMLHSVRTLFEQSRGGAERIRPAADRPESGSVLRRLRLPYDQATRTAAAEWRDDYADDLAEEHRPWNGRPRVTESPARTAVAGRDPRIGAAGRNLPLFGSAGAFPGWAFVQPVAENSVQAYDEVGRLRWQFEPQIVFNDQARRYFQSYNTVSERYLLACGHLLAVKLQHMLFVLDCSTASGESPPTVLWELNLSTELERATDRQGFDDAWQRTEQYDIQPAGLFPVGPLTTNGLPLYSGRQLRVVDPLTGRRAWQVDGLPGDCTLTGTEQELCLISELSGQIEVRDMLDGSVTRRVPLPDWWTEANENSNSSIADFEIEPGTDTYWRIAVSEGRCLLFRLTSEKSSLELFSLADNSTVWQVTLPADSCFSNIAGGMVAVLSESNRLRIFDAESGETVSDLTVPDAPACRALYLRPCHERLLVLTESVDDPSYDLNPISDTNPINGWIYAIDGGGKSLLWSRRTDHELLRILTPGQQPPFTPAAPLLVLLKRPSDKLPDGSDAPTAHYAARVLDARTGEELFAEEDLGRTLNYHALRMDPQKRQIAIGFEVRNVTFDYDDTPDGDQSDPD
ncbi:MAG: PQQ-binding-like beta-propeller repeat protein [Planctomycetaceae bacterium]